MSEKTFLDVVTDLGLALDTRARLLKISKLSWDQQPKAFLRIIWDSLRISVQRRVVSQFGARVEHESIEIPVDCWGVEGTYDEEGFYYPPCRVEHRYTAYRNDILGPLNYPHDNEQDALDDCFESLADDYSAALFFKLIKRPGLTVTQPLVEL
jgi:hypothetical protein